jgi:hypothetical protein
MDETGVSLLRGPVGGPGWGGPSTGYFENLLKDDSGYGASLFMVALLREAGGGSFARAPDGDERKALRTDICLHGGSAGQTGVDSSTRDFDIWLKDALEVESFSVWELFEGNLEGGVPCWGPRRICTSRKGSGDWHLFP